MNILDVAYEWFSLMKWQQILLLILICSISSFSLVFGTKRVVESIYLFYREPVNCEYRQRSIYRPNIEFWVNCTDRLDRESYFPERDYIY